MPTCNVCGNKCEDCLHAAEMTCTECERDDNAVILDGICFFCLCENKARDFNDYKPRDIMYRDLKVVRLGKRRRKLGLPPPVFSEKHQVLYDLFMEGYKD